MTEFFGEAVSDLIDLVTCQGVLSRDIVGVVSLDFLAPDVGFNRNPGRLKSLQDVDQLYDFLLAPGRKYVVGLRVEDVVSRVGHVIDAEHQHFGAGGRGRRRLL